METHAEYKKAFKANEQLFLELCNTFLTPIDKYISVPWEEHVKKIKVANKSDMMWYLHRIIREIYFIEYIRIDFRNSYLYGTSHFSIFNNGITDFETAMVDLGNILKHYKEKKIITEDE